MFGAFALHDSFLVVGYVVKATNVTLRRRKKVLQREEEEEEEEE